MMEGAEALSPGLNAPLDKQQRDPLSQDPDEAEGNSISGRDCPPLTMMHRTTPTLVEEQLSPLQERPRAFVSHSSPTTPFSERRLSSSVPASTNIVEALFGPGLGPCWGDFSCTYNRIRGRLYATSQAVLFYTNLLGFERRICLLLREVQHMELFRTTSLRFGTMDDETYIFKSFNDREQVLHLLSGLKILAHKQQAESGKASARMPTTPGSSTRRSSTNSQPRPTSVAFSPSSSMSNFHSQLSFPPPPIPPPSNRRRAVSDSILRLPRVDSNESVNSILEPESLLGEEPSLEFDIRPEVPIEREEEEEAAEASLSTMWQKAKQDKSPPLAEVGIDAIVLPCDLDTFFQTFWADHAKYSLEYYQREYVKDKDVQLTGWDLGSDGYFRRTMKFRHPIQNSLGLGPSAADTTRHQKLRQYTGLGIILENRTLVSGIPAADSFFVQDHWVLGAVGENKVQLTVRYDTRFTKRSMFKSIISKSIRKETKEWMAGYLDMVQTVLAEKSSNAVPKRLEQVICPVPVAESQKFMRETVAAAYRLVVLVSLAFFLLGFTACVHLYRLQEAVLRLHEDLQALEVCHSQAEPTAFDPILH
jgi:hypothetical protein